MTTPAAPAPASTSASASAPSAPASSSSNPTNTRKPTSPIAPLPLHPNLDLDVAPLCRVCRSDDPSLGQLFHPCRCTGSIAHVHQDCLSTWLSHSKKSSCELCGHLFSFEKVYKPGSPARPPWTTITFQALIEIFRFFLLFSRALLVGLCWLGIVPWSVIWVSTAYWKASDWFALGITSSMDQSSRSSNLSSHSPLSSTSKLNSTTTSSGPAILIPKSSSSFNTTLSTWITNIVPPLDLDPNSIALDIFQGQLITCAIILSFVVIFLLREWILQNTPPPDLIQEDEDGEPPQQHFPPVVEVPVFDEDNNIPIRNPPEPILPLEPEDLAWSHATHFIFADTPSQEAPSNPTIPTDSDLPTVTTQASSDDHTPEIEPNAIPEKITSFCSSSININTEQPVTTPGLLELADPGLGMPFYKAHDPFDSDIFCHRVLVTSVFLLFISDKSDSRPLVFGPPQSPHFGDLDEQQKKLMKAWSNLVELTILHPSSGISSSVSQLRNFVLRPNSADHPSIDTQPYQEIELNWTRAVLSDQKISKHIQHFVNTRSSTQVNQTQDQIRQKGLIYSLISIYMLIESQNAMIHESNGSTDDFEPPNNCYGRIYDVLRLFVLPLLDLPPNGEEQSDGDKPQLNELEADIYQMIQKHDPTTNFTHDHVDDLSDVSFLSSLQDTIVKILVKQQILSTLINSPTFIRYSRGMAFDDNLFTNWRLKSTRGFSPKFLYPQVGGSVVANPENDLSEITIQLINYKASTMATAVEPCSLFNPHNDGAVDWVDYSTLEHKLLVTSSYLLFSDEEAVADIVVPALQTPTFNSLLENTNAHQDPSDFSSLLEAWSKLIRSCTTKPTSDLLQHFKNFSLRTSAGSTEARRVHSFQKLETEWLSKLLKDPSIAQFLVSILTTTKNGGRDQNDHPSSRTMKGSDDNRTLNLFLLKLVYVYIALETIVPSRSAEAPNAKQQPDPREMIQENGLKVLEEHLNRLEESSTAEEEEGRNDQETRNKSQILEMIRETRFLLDAFRPSQPSASKLKAMSSNPFSNSTTNHLPGGDLRSDLFIGRRLKRGIVGILARQKVLNMIVTDRKFSKYARSMLSEQNLFSRIPGLSSNLQQLDDDEEEDPNSQLDEQKIDFTKGKEKVLVPQEEASKDGRQKIQTNSDFTRPSLPKSTKSCTDQTVPEPDSNAPNDQQPVRDRPLQIALPQERENDFEAAPNHEINRVRVQVAGRLVAGHPHEFAPRRGAQADAVLAAGIGAGLADVFAFDDPNVNGGDDELMAEDIDGILELIGMKGSLLMLAQNVGLMTMLLSLSLLAFVHLPHMMGKIAILVKAHRLLAPPFKGLLILQRYVHRMLDCLSDYLKAHFKNYQLPVKLERALSLVGGSGQSITGLSQWVDRWPFDELLRTSKHLDNQMKSIISKMLPWNTIWIKLEQQVTDQMNSIAYGSKPLDRALAVLIGYFELILMSLLYLSSGLDQQRAKFVSETLVNGLQQQLLIGKVGIFIFVELVIFPFLCGLLLNFTTIPIFANATLSNRLELYSSSPYSATLITWLVGTCFMFTFAILVSTCRESLRAGVCWWIRDPSDDRFNPIREILERSAWSQIKKISVSAVMYGAVIVCGLGSIVFNLVFFTGVLPLRIHADRPISSSALDLVIYQTFLPLFLECFKPRTKLKECLQGISRFMARQLRLTCYLYGERRFAEETTIEVVVRGLDGKIRPLERRAKFLPLTFFKSYRFGSSNLKNNGSTDKGGSISHRMKWAGGSFARVPATDSVKVVQGRKMHIPVHVDGTPIDPADMAIIEQQQAEAREEGGGAGPDQYTIVYLPPQFQTRMIIYVISMWSAAVTIVWQSIGIPLLIGRTMLDRFFLSEQDEPHDVYAYAIGVLACAVTFSIGKKLWEKYSKYYRNNLANRSGKSAPLETEDGDEENDIEEAYSNHQQSIFQKMNRIIKKSFHFLVLTLGGGVFLPILTSILVDLYILGLVKPKPIQSGGLPEIFLLEAWSYGAICLSIGARAIKLSLPGHPISIAQDEIMAHWQAGNLDRVIEDINLKLIIPVSYKFSLMILVPFLVVQPLIMIIFNRYGNYGFRFNDQPEEETNRFEWIFKIMGIISSWTRSWNGLLTNKGLNLTDHLNIQNRADGLNQPSNGSTATNHHEDRNIKLMELNYLILKLVYPLILSWFSQFYFLKIFFKVFSGWLEKVRDERFLERRRLRNYEPDPTAVPNQ